MATATAEPKKLNEEIFALTAAIQKLDEAILEKSAPMIEKRDNIQRVIDADTKELTEQRDVMKRELDGIIEKNMPAKKARVWPKWFKADRLWRAVGGFSFVTAMVTTVWLMVTAEANIQASLFVIVVMIFLGTYATDSANDIYKKEAAQ